MPVHLTPIEQPAGIALLTGDPRRAFALAGGLMVQPRMSHQARGLWGYTGTTPEGLDLTVQATGTGGPSAAAVLGDLADLGVKRVIRLGTCVAADAGPALGSLLLVEGAICRDGLSSGLEGAGSVTRPNERFLEQLEGLAVQAMVSSHDFVARSDPSGNQPEPGAVARDLQSATILALARRLEIEAAALLLVSSDSRGESLTEAGTTEPLVEIGRQVIDRLQTLAY